MKKLAGFLELLSELRGFRRFFLCFTLGFVAAFAFPPFNMIFFLWLSFPLFFYVLKNAESGKAALLMGWSFAFGQLVVCLHWIAAALFVEISAFWWALPLAVGGLPAFLSVYYGVAALLAFKYGLERWEGLLVFGLFWMGAEMARALLFTGMPWDLLGYVWAERLPVLQSASLFGIEGLTFLTIFLALLPAFFFFRGEGRVGFYGAVCVMTVFLGLTLWGQARLDGAVLSYVDGVRLRLVRGDQDQSLKWREDQRLANFQRLLDATFSGDDGATHIFWPETATAYYLAEEPGVRARIAERMTKGSTLLTGAVRRQRDADGELRYFNSLVALNAKGDVIAGYDKKHLVPFGEYFPFRALFPFRVVTALGVDFMAGEGKGSLRVPSLPPFGALVCYEAIFSGDVADREDSPAFLLNVTNDAWYEGTIGPAQHFAIARVRAVEEGVPLVRVANKGVTAVVDPWGRVESRAPDDGQSLVDSRLPREIPEKTFFHKRGRMPLGLVVLALASVALALRLTRKKSARY